MILCLILLVSILPMASAEDKVTVRMNTCIVFSDLRDREKVEARLDELLEAKGYSFKV